MSSNNSPNLVAEVEALKSVYAAINRNEIQATLQYFDPQIERIEPAGFPTAGTYHGHAELLAHISNGRGTWAEGTCEPEDFIVAGDKIVVYVYVHVRLKNSTDWIDARFADGFVFRSGKATAFHSFGTRDEALNWAGIKR